MTSERERAEFEEAFYQLSPVSREQFRLWVLRNDKGEYISADTNGYWKLWQAARLAERKRCAEIAQNIKLKYKGQPVHDAIADEIRALDKETA